MRGGSRQHRFAIQRHSTNRFVCVCVMGGGEEGGRQCCHQGGLVGQPAQVYFPGGRLAGLEGSASPPQFAPASLVCRVFVSRSTTPDIHPYKYSFILIGYFGAAHIVLIYLNKYTFSVALISDKRGNFHWLQLSNLGI